MTPNRPARWALALCAAAVTAVSFTPAASAAKKKEKDSWLQATKGKETPYFCCLKTPTANDKPPFPGNHRIDHILIKGKKIKGLKATVVGTNPKNRTSTGLWPSDHGGWVSSLRLSR